MDYIHFSMTSKPVRTRIAPSPTGNLHVGTARTALFNELFARKYGGSFIVRLEDTDKQRSTREYEQNILEGLAWLGLSWDEGPDKGGSFGPYRQSERTQIYTTALHKLLDTGKASYGEGETIVLNVDPQEVVFEDSVRGSVHIHTNDFGGNFIIARTLQDPLFHLAVVVDDAAMEITHVIRGEDHLHNTAKHILIQRALEYETPVYAHLPLLLDERRAKLSKRSGETNLLAYRDMGYLPGAMLNYLALLGWSPKDDREFFAQAELIEAFSLEGIQKGGAIFSMHKLNAVNKEYMRKLTAKELTSLVAPYLGTSASMRLEAAVATEQSRAITLKELAELIDWATDDWDGAYEASLLVWRKSSAETTTELLRKLSEKLAGIPDEDFEEKKLEKLLLAWIDQEGFGRGDTLWPMRVALTGREHSPGPFEVAGALGKKEALRRIDAAIAKFT